MRTLLAATLLLIPFLPTVDAAHYGPCTHEYFAIVQYTIENKDPEGGAAYLTWCAVDYNVYWVCRAIRCDAIALDLPPVTLP